MKSDNRKRKNCVSDVQDNASEILESYRPYLNKQRVKSEHVEQVLQFIGVIYHSNVFGPLLYLVRKKCSSSLLDSDDLISDTIKVIDESQTDLVVKSVESYKSLETLENYQPKKGETLYQITISDAPFFSLKDNWKTVTKFPNLVYSWYSERGTNDVHFILSYEDNDSNTDRESDRGSSMGGEISRFVNLDEYCRKINNSEEPNFVDGLSKCPEYDRLFQYEKGIVKQFLSAITKNPNNTLRNFDVKFTKRFYEDASIKSFCDILPESIINLDTGIEIMDAIEIFSESEKKSKIDRMDMEESSSIFKDTKGKLQTRKFVPFFKLFGKFSSKKEYFFVEIINAPPLSLNIIQSVCGPYAENIVDIVIYSPRFSKRRGVDFNILFVLDLEKGLKVTTKTKQEKIKNNFI